MRPVRVVAIAAILVVIQSANVTGGPVVAAGEDSGELRSLKPEAVLTKLDLERLGLSAVKAEMSEGDRPGALAALLTHYRTKSPLGEPTGEISRGSLKKADGVANHIFQWGPYEAADYGETVRWEWDPRGDIEWVAAMYRFHWAVPLTKAFEETRDEKYAEAFVELTRDWIAKHPLEEHEKPHDIYTNWRGYVWLDVQTGIRATRLCSSFPTMVHAEAFTPEFLGVFLASMYDHQMKTELLPGFGTTTLRRPRSLRFSSRTGGLKPQRSRRHFLRVMKSGRPCRASCPSVWEDLADRPGSGETDGMAQRAIVLEALTGLRKLMAVNREIVT